MVHDAVSVGVGEELGTVAHQSSGGNTELDMRHAAVAGAHVDQLRLAGAELFHDRSDVRIGNLDNEELHRLTELAVDGLGDDLGTRYLKLVVLATHGLNQNGKMKLASARYLEGVSAVGFLDAQGDVGFDLLEQSVAQVAGGDVLALLAREGRIVDDEVHSDGRLVDLDEGQRLHTVTGTDGLADVDVLNAADADDVAEPCFVALGSFQSLELIERADTDDLGGSIGMTKGHTLAVLNDAALDSADADPADEVVGVDIGNQELETRVLLALGSGNFFDDGFKQRLHILALYMIIVARVAVTRGRVDDRELELVVIGSELDKEVEHLVDDLLGSCAGTVDLIEHDQRLFAEAERLFQHEARLWHTALKCINEQYNAVHHLQDALYLAAEIGVSGGVYNVDFDAVIHHGGGLGQNRDAALTLEVVGVHDSLLDVLVRSENAALTQQLVDQRRLAVVDVGNDRDVP